MLKMLVWRVLAVMGLVLGLGRMPQPTQAAPVAKQGIASVMEMAVQVAAGGDHTCAITSAGGVKCWGSNFRGQLGNNSTANSQMPVDVVGLSSGVNTIGAGYGHTCALTNAGAVKCWGYNVYGQLGNNSTTDSLVPVDVAGLSSGVSAINVGGTHTCALTIAGAVKCWGYNGYGQLGNNSTVNSPAPVDVFGLSGGVRVISASASHTCALTIADVVKCWGANFFGQLGNNSTAGMQVPVDVTGLSGGVSAISAGSDHTCALTSAGEIKCWGSNGSGGLGNNGMAKTQVSVDVVGLSSGINTISAGDGHTCALTSAGAVKCWGYNAFGQLGNNSTADTQVPVDVIGLSSGVSAISAGRLHTCALTIAGIVKCWGFNFYGQLGNNGTANAQVPVDVIGLSSGVSAISVGSGHTCALTSAGGVKCWGANWDGQLGNSSTTSSGVPMDVVGLSSGVGAISAGNSHTCALTIAGTVKCWGLNRFGELGNDNAWKTTPQDVVGFSSPSTPTGDRYENDDTCDKATFLTANIETQNHTFNKPGDTDWVRIEVVTGTNYTLVADNLTDGALPALKLQDYRCDTPPLAVSPPSFGGEVRIPIPANEYPPGSYWLRITNVPTSTYGNTVSYTLNLRALSFTGAAIIVAGKNGGASFQNVITQTTDLAYTTLLRNGFSKDNILYLDNQTSRDVDGNGIADDIDQPATVANLQNAIVTWAATRVGPAKPLWVYMADHGYADQFLVSGDGLNDSVTPNQLDGWLSQLEAATGVDQVNVIIDACESGSFITQPGSISRGRRVILTSTSADRIAMGRPPSAGVIQRMYFSEAVWSGLDANLTLREAFDQGRAAALRSTNQYQQAWMDDNGDGNPNSASDGLNADFRGMAGSVTTGGRPVVGWPNAITSNGVLVVSARAGARVSHVHVEVLRPGTSQTVVAGELNLLNADKVTLSDSGNGIWVGTYGGFDTPGIYLLVAYAWDTDGSPALPVETTVEVDGAPITPTPSPTPTATASPTPTPTTTRTPTATASPTNGSNYRAFLPLVRR